MAEEFDCETLVAQCRAQESVPMASFHFID